MAANKKPRKRYIPKPAVLPAGLRKDFAFEIPGFQASEAMGKGHFQELHAYNLLSNADMARRIAPDGHAILPVAQAVVEAIAEIMARAQRTGTFGVNGDEMCALREGVGKTMVFLGDMPNVEIARALLSNRARI
ncbi:hypothetical protein [Janthinobacterium sp. HLS12-2]|uniref:hypothetical protein n=1 Tax=Janthinobacterium sp. HLS12-2 TaxID=1259324 RepID=UPI003F236933